jgi:hypothetical protein
VGEVSVDSDSPTANATTGARGLSITRAGGG